MKKKLNRIVFFGNERLATGVTTSNPVLRSLIDVGYDVCAVVANNEESSSRKLRQLEVAVVAEKHEIALFTPKKLLEIKDDLQRLEAEIGILVAYGKMVPDEIIKLFPSGIVNIHPSLLPKHRGPTPIESVILSGEKATGVSLMSLVKEMDSGPVYAYSQLDLNGDESKQDLSDVLSNLGSRMLIELLPGIINGSIVGEPQNNSLATYDHLLEKQSGIIDWNKSSVEIERQIRAFQVWPRSIGKIGRLEVIITRAGCGSENIGNPGEYLASKEFLKVACGDGYIEIYELQPQGKKIMPIKAFLAGYKDRL